ncbi:MAG TPA: Hsp20/alpha crystallin family protein [Acidobacteriota bacterium]|jgi:HSP20 family protein|nr:Hsp20/alpha crystallin family protein [Acidobacteriota bacterium]
MVIRKRFDALGNLIAFQEQLNRLFADEFEITDSPSDWIPPVDIYEAADRYVLQAEVPGLDSESIRIEVNQNQLQIHGERKPFAEAEKYHLAEIPHGEFTRNFQLPVAIQSDQVKAQLSDGILIIDLPKQIADEARRIEIR